VSQARSPFGPRYAIVQAAGAAADARLPRAAQSASADEVLRQLRYRSGISAGPSAKSHSRAMAAAAVAPNGHIGIDVEYRSPGRPIRAIVRLLAGEGAGDEKTAYRVFTFVEAYFKAFARLPDRPLTHAVACATEPLIRPRGDMGVLHIAPAQAFVLTLVWTGGGAPERISFDGAAGG
jgi:hypothetical protein